MLLLFLLLFLLLLRCILWSYIPNSVPLYKDIHFYLYICMYEWMNDYYPTIHSQWIESNRNSFVYFYATQIWIYDVHGIVIHKPNIIFNPELFYSIPMWMRWDEMKWDRQPSPYQPFIRRQSASHRLLTMQVMLMLSISVPRWIPSPSAKANTATLCMYAFVRMGPKSEHNRIG